MDASDFLQGSQPNTFKKLFYEVHNPQYHDMNTLSRNVLLPI